MLCLYIEVNTYLLSVWMRLWCSSVLMHCRLARTGFEELDAVPVSSDVNDSWSSGTPHQTASYVDDPRIPMSSGLLVELLSGVYYAMLVHCCLVFVNMFSHLITSYLIICTCYPHMPMGMLWIYRLLFVYYPHMPIGMLWIYRLLFVCFFVCLSAGFFVRDISGVGGHRAMKFGRMVDLGG